MDETVPAGEQGEVCARGYMVMKGYDGEPEATARAIDAEGWLHTGDLGVMREDGYIHLTGRAKDMIIRGGENVYPREVEEFLYTHPKVAEVQVVGIPDERLGEVVVAWIRLKAEESVDRGRDTEILRGKDRVLQDSPVCALRGAVSHDGDREDSEVPHPRDRDHRAWPGKGGEAGDGVEALRRRHPIRFTKARDGVPQSVIEQTQCGDCDAARNTPIKRPGDPSRNACQGVGITAKRNRQPDCVFVVLGIEKRYDRFGNGSVARFVERVGRPDARDSPAQIVTKLLFYRTPDFPFRLTLSRQEYGGRRGLGAANSLRVIVGYVRTGLRFLEHILESLKCESHRAHSHRRAVTPAVVGGATPTLPNAKIRRRNNGRDRPGCTDGNCPHRKCRLAGIGNR